jgi:hypothetical protein
MIAVFAKNGVAPKRGLTNFSENEIFLRIGNSKFQVMAFFLLSEVY